MIALLLLPTLLAIGVAVVALLPLLIHLPVDSQFISTNGEDHAPTIWWEGQERRKPRGVWLDILLELFELDSVGVGGSGTRPRPRARSRSTGGPRSVVILSNLLDLHHVDDRR